MSDDELDLLLLDGNESPSEVYPKAPMKHGLIINVGPHRQWVHTTPGGGGGVDITSSGPEMTSTPANEISTSVISLSNSALPSSASTNSHQFYINASEDALKKTSSIIEGLLTEIYDRGYHLSGINRDSVDSDTTFTEYSSTCEMRMSGISMGMHTTGAASGVASPKLLLNCDSLAQKQSEKSQRSYMSDKSVLELRAMIAELQHRVSQTSSRLVRLLKKKDKQLERQHNYCDIITASLQASSLKRRVDTRIKFSVTPGCGRRGFRQWHDALRAMCRLPSGIPRQLRKKVWLCLADHYLNHLKIDWEKTVRYTFNDRSNPDDEKLGVQIVKDLHRTGYSGFSSGEGAEAGRALLKRVLLAYARWNKQVGYCQGFNVLAATLLQVCEGNEGDALKLMIYLIDKVLPQNYFSHNLRALSVDMAVFRDLLRAQQPLLSAHFDKLQSLANSVPFRTGPTPSTNSSTATYEPPLTNVFTMQWFLTLFATCLPKATVLRVWDSIFLEGSEMLLRVALTVWEKISHRILQVESADEFYSLMAQIQSEMFDYDLIDCETLIQTVYSMGPTPLANLSDLREKYTYNITPFSPMHQATSGSSSSVGGKGGGNSSSHSGSGLSVDKLRHSDEEEDSDDRATFIRCFPGFPSHSSPVKNSKDVFSGDESSGSGTGLNQVGRGKGANGLTGNGAGADLLTASPGAYSSPCDPSLPSAAPLERMSTDIYALKKQYSKLQQRMQQVHVIYYDKAPPLGGRDKSDEKPIEVVNPIKTNVAINHLFVVNKDQTRTQLSLPERNCEPVNHLTIKPYIPSDPLSSSSNGTSPTESGLSTPQLCTNGKSKQHQRHLPNAKHKLSSQSTSNHSTHNWSSGNAINSCSSDNLDDLSNRTCNVSTSDSLSLETQNLLSSERENGDHGRDNTHLSSCSTRSNLSNSIPRPGSSPISPISPEESGLIAGPTEGPRTSSQVPTPEATSKGAAVEYFDFEVTGAETTEQLTNIFSASGTSTPSSGHQSTSKVMYRKPPMKPNIRPNLGMNDRPRIYNPFPVNYVHNSKLKKGKSLGLYSGVNSKQQSGGGESVLGKLGLK